MRLLLLIFLLCPALLLASTNHKDSLTSNIRNTNLHDTLRLESVIKLISEFYLSDKSDSAIVLTDEFIRFAQARKQLKYVVKLMNQKGIALMFSGKLENSITQIKAALKIAESMNDIKLINSCYGNMAGSYYQMGNYREALYCYERILEYQNAIKPEISMAKTLTNISNIYSDIGLNQLARKYLWMAYRLRIRLRDEVNIANTVINLGSSYFETDQLDSAWHFTRYGEKLCRESGNKKLLALSLNNLGEIQVLRKDFYNAISFFQQALILREEVGDVIGTLTTRVHLANCLLEIGKQNKAFVILVDGFEKANNLGSTRLINKISALLYNEYKRQHLYKEAIQMNDAFLESKAKLNTEELSRTIIQQQLKADFDQKSYKLERAKEIETIKVNQQIRQEQILRNIFISAFIIASIFACVILIQRNRIKNEQKRSESLLLNILPYETAQELKAKGEAEAKFIDNVTVLFTDFKGFTAMAETMSPKELVNDLNICFSEFDRIIGKYGIEKIKTIGDSYMAAGGLPTPNNTHASDVVNAAFEIAQFIEEGKQRKLAAGLPYFEIRIGIHTGPVVAGIVGIKKFSYDIWGDTVNTASRMENSGEVGKINVSEATYELVKRQFNCKYRGKVEAKGKGMIKMYFVNT
jgi:adenylate cyclase